MRTALMDQTDTPPRLGLTRRGVLQGGAGLALWGGIAADFAKQAAAMPVAELAGDDLDLHLLRRTSFGPTPAALASVRSMGAEAYLEQQLVAVDDACELEVLQRYPLATADPAAVYLGTAGGFSPQLAISQLQAATLYRAVNSQAQLFEVMVDFWNDHFNTYVYKNPIPLKVCFDHEVIRPHALGNFKSMLRATVRHAEMLHYLDNWINTADAVNENYARELLELHTLGRDGGYTEADLKALARILTGLSYSRDIQGDVLNGVSYADAVFHAHLHDSEEKYFLGAYFPAGGQEEEIDRALDLILNHPGTARFIATKLCRRFVSDEPSAALISRVAEQFVISDGDIPSLLRVILLSAEFHDSLGAKLKRPMNAIVSAVRACGISNLSQTLTVNLFGTVNGAGLLAQQLKAAGHLPFEWVPPDGYPDHNRYWSNTNSLLNQQKYLVALVESLSYDRLLNDPVAFAQEGNSNASDVAPATTPRQAVSNAIDNLLLQAMPDSARAILLDLVAQQDDPDAVLAAGELQKRVNGLVFVLLASPWFLRR